MPSHDPRDDGSTAVTLTDEQSALLASIVRSWAAAAPAGWLRVVTREECSVAPESDGIGSVRIVVVETPDGLEQETFRPSDELYFETSDLLRELAAGSPTQTIVLDVVIDRDGRTEATVVVDTPRVLVGIRDETSSKPVHQYLERNRAELTALLG
ncbi:hypothetical protein [Cellulomonas xylanilytica]|uniref:Uncharacterized protein n=1 Tax=Cellulomonas xylanilytica TaxID=233583 RepID=A0A510V7R9_9CELL|nr:hypothetical protein [Cellulomonas xylanilytica]GEK22913.1 hypothetical protein CXY01_34330 [Cellulomonas xylanilytica]